jgi:hypothetical protein
MLIDFSVSNYLSFNDKETFSMTAGKTRKYSDRLYNDKNLKLTKCEVIFGANASGKSNVVSAFQFVQNMVLDGFPRGFSNKYYRLDQKNKNKPSEFEIKILCDSNILCFGFFVELATGSILKEYLYEITRKNNRKILFERDTLKEEFFVGPYFKQSDAIAKLNNYGVDSSNDQEILFLSLINKNRGKLFEDFPELKILRNVFEWFATRLNISFPESILTGYPYFTDSNLEEIADIMKSLGTGISELKIVEIPVELIKSKIPDELYNKIVSDLEKENARANKENSDNRPKVMARSYKEFYTFEINADNEITITTIEFSHETSNTYFNLNEESDGTVRILDLIEILFKISNDHIFVIDEIDRCLHPAMTVKIVELFLEMAKRRNAQLVITSHESRLLAADILRNDEIYFMNKDMQGGSHIISLESNQLRADKKVYAALFDGTLDAIPVFDENKLKEVLNK